MHINTRYWKDGQENNLLENSVQNISTSSEQDGSQKNPEEIIYEFDTELVVYDSEDSASFDPEGKTKNRLQKLLQMKHNQKKIKMLLKEKTTTKNSEVFTESGVTPIVATSNTQFQKVSDKPDVTKPDNATELVKVLI